MGGSILRHDPFFSRPSGSELYGSENSGVSGGRAGWGARRSGNETPWWPDGSVLGQANRSHGRGGGSTSQMARRAQRAGARARQRLTLQWGCALPRGCFSRSRRPCSPLLRCRAGRVNGRASSSRNTFFNHELIEFSRMGSGFAGDSACWFYSCVFGLFVVQGHPGRLGGRRGSAPSVFDIWAMRDDGPPRVYSLPRGAVLRVRPRRIRGRLE
jgi:hypothetical protein